MTNRLMITNIILSQKDSFQTDSIYKKCLEIDKTIKESTVILVLYNLAERGVILRQKDGYKVNPNY